MQPTPLRLSQTLWTAFRAAKPTHRQSFLQHTRTPPERPALPRCANPTLSLQARSLARCHSDHAKRADVEEKVKDTEQRIEQSLDSRADVLTNKDSTPKSHKDETLPEASSIVFTKESESGNSTGSKPLQDDPRSDSNGHPWNDNKYATWASSRWQNSPLPSQIAELRSKATTRFTTFMDNFQSQIVIAAHHLNDLTGYTGIERLKKDIEAQEAAVQNSRQHVKDSREQYAEAIAMRSTTQREVNDLLHRKHAWSPTDLERFTHLYRSDHANEQAESKSHQTLSEAEAQYEEASTRLAKSILARYHEEQIWSDKIRQMSTWGTWGLMGLNVLLFIVFQIAIEPWRRKRLVRGFEEKVQKALDEKEKVTDEKLALITAQRRGDQVVQEAVQKQPEGLVATAAEQVAEAIVDAVSGTTDQSEPANQAPSAEDIENAAEQVATTELEDENQANNQTTPSIEAESIAAADAVDADLNTGLSATSSQAKDLVETLYPEPEPTTTPQNWQDQLTSTYQHAVRTTTGAYAHYSDAFVQQFNEKEHIVLSKRELTTRILEGVATGVALSCGVMFVVVRSR